MLKLYAVISDLCVFVLVLFVFPGFTLLLCILKVQIVPFLRLLLWEHCHKGQVSLQQHNYAWHRSISYFPLVISDLTPCRAWEHLGPCHCSSHAVCGGACKRRRLHSQEGWCLLLYFCMFESICSLCNCAWMYQAEYLCIQYICTRMSRWKERCKYVCYFVSFLSFRFHTYGWQHCSVKRWEVYVWVMHGVDTGVCCGNLCNFVESVEWLCHVRLVLCHVFVVLYCVVQCWECLFNVLFVVIVVVCVFKLCVNVC